MHTFIHTLRTSHMHARYLSAILFCLCGLLGSGCAPELLKEGSYIGTLSGHQVAWDGTYSDLSLDLTLALSNYEEYNPPENMGDAVFPSDEDMQQTFLLEGLEGSLAAWFGNEISISLLLIVTGDDTFAYAQFTEITVDLSAAHGEPAGTCMEEVELNANATLISNQEFEFSLYLNMYGSWNEGQDRYTSCASQYGVPQSVEVTGTLTYRE